MRPFLVCIHDITPAYARETRAMIRDLAPLVGRCLSLAVVPDWHGEWPLDAHPDYCREIREAAEDLLLHGYSHRRQRGYGPTTLLTGGADEMNGLHPEATRAAIARGQQVFTEVFGKPTRGFLAPAWQPGHLRAEHAEALGLGHVLGFFSLRSSTGRRIPLATWTWDCGRIAPLGHLGHACGRLLHMLDGRVPVLAIHPLDIQRGFWPAILQITHELLETGLEPSTPARLLASAEC